MYNIISNLQPSMVILNLGCGSRTSARCINIDWSIYLRIKKSKIASFLAPFVLHGCPLRLERLKALDDRIIVHDFLKGIPFSDASVDAVYHSHLLEHLDRSVAERFVREVRRVLKPAGIHRIVVPDFEDLCRRYLEHLERCMGDGTGHEEHDNYIAGVILQMVRREAFGTSQQRPLWRWIENILLGTNCLSLGGKGFPLSLAITSSNCLFRISLPMNSPFKGEKLIANLAAEGTA